MICTVHKNGLVIFQKSQIYMEDIFKPDSTKSVDKDKFLCHLHTLGEVALYDRQRVSEKTFQLLQQFLSISDASGKNRFLLLDVFSFNTDVLLNLENINFTYESVTFFLSSFIMCSTFLWQKLKINCMCSHICVFMHCVI